jgi:hypothetical protein
MRRRAPPRPTMAGVVRAFPHPCNALLWTHHLLSIIPVALVIDLVARRPRFPRTGELSIVRNGSAAVSSPNSGGCAPLPSSIYSEPFITRSTAHKAPYPFAGSFLKEPLSFGRIQPAVLGIFPKYALSFWRRISFGLNEKYVSRLITVLPLQ